jgi:predicted nuclease of predicted toxin-antitoxin system
MPRTIRFHLDEHVDHAVADGLRRRGIDCSTTVDASLLGAHDPDQLAFAKSQGRVLFSNDADFLCAHNQGIEHCGIAYCHQQSPSVGEIIRALELIWEVLEPEEMHNQVEFV